MTRADKETHTIEANRALDRRAKEILRQGSALMTYAEALAKARASAREGLRSQEKSPRHRGLFLCLFACLFHWLTLENTEISEYNTTRINLFQ